MWTASRVAAHDLRFIFHSKIAFLNPKTKFAFLYLTDESKITKIMVHQTNRRISRQGFFGSVDAPWSEWSWIHLFGKETRNLLLDLIKNPILDFLKEMHFISLLRSYWVRGLTCGRSRMRTQRESSAMTFSFSLNEHIWTQSFNNFGVKEGPNFVLTTSLADIIGLKTSTTSLQSVPKTSLLQCFLSSIQ